MLLWAIIDGICLTHISEFKNITHALQHVFPTLEATVIIIIVIAVDYVAAAAIVAPSLEQSFAPQDLDPVSSLPDQCAQVHCHRVDVKKADFCWHRNC